MAELQQDLDDVIDIYSQVLAVNDGEALPEIIEPQQSDEPLPVRADLREAIETFSTALRASGVKFGGHHDGLVTSFISSLVTKPLVILTGLSGSGKTQIAIRFGEWLGKHRLHVAAVRPDWTGAEALFGYEDALKRELDGRRAWTVPAPLEFILKAADDPQHPYLLLLDEMNLAHVERYFADVLSGMESGQPCIPNLHKGTDDCWRLKTGADKQIPLPANLWIVGTVNIDETTYMFSPKVLDRANTFEFRVHFSDLSTDAIKPQPCAAGDQELVRGLLSIALDNSWHRERPEHWSWIQERRAYNVRAEGRRGGVHPGAALLSSQLLLLYCPSTQEVALTRIVSGAEEVSETGMSESGYPVPRGNYWCVQIQWLARDQWLQGLSPHAIDTYVRNLGLEYGEPISVRWSEILSLAGGT